jgi:hypothetical protein
MKRRAPYRISQCSVFGNVQQHTHLTDNRNFIYAPQQSHSTGFARD